MAEKKTFGLINEKGVEVGIYTGVVPRQAALKAANDGKTLIILREKGTKKLHYFKGNRVLVPVNATAPAWIKAKAEKNNGKVWHAIAEKQGTGKLEKNELAKNPKELFKLPVKVAPKK